MACHTTILMARCATIAQGALSTIREGVEGRWVVRSMEGKEVGLEVVRDHLNFIYTSTLSEERVKKRVEELLELAHMYQLAGLVDTCREAALQQITVDNSLHTLATLHKFALVDGKDEQKEVAIRFVQRNLARVRGTKDWETFTSTFPNLVKVVERVKEGQAAAVPGRSSTASLADYVAGLRKVLGKEGVQRFAAAMREYKARGQFGVLEEMLETHILGNSKEHPHLLTNFRAFVKETHRKEFDVFCEKHSVL